MSTANRQLRALPLFPDAFTPEIKPNTSTLLPLHQYWKILVMFSAGKDSLYATLRLLEMGVNPERIELWHQHVDGRPVHLGGEPGLFDWPVSCGYTLAAGQSLGLKVLFQWREGGIEREMLRERERTQPCSFQLGDGTTKTSGGSRGLELTRRMFPQVGSIQNGRWCSPAVKIDVANAAICGDPRFQDKTILVVSGERREESVNRSKYAEVEEHKATNNKRRVDQWRIIIDAKEEEVWDALKRYRILPHVCYRLGFSRCSCMTCIFLGREWATIRQIANARFNKISSYERVFGKTIKQGMSVIEQAERGTSFIQPGDEALIEEALSHEFPANRFFLPPGVAWELPRGAFRGGCGPA